MKCQNNNVDHTGLGNSGRFQLKLTAITVKTELAAYLVPSFF